MVDIGAYGSQSDSGIFKNSVSGDRLDKGTMNVPSSKELRQSNTKMPNFFVADEAFPLKQYIMRPFPGRHLSLSQKKYLITAYHVLGSVSKTHLRYLLLGGVY